MKSFKAYLVFFLFSTSTVFPQFTVISSIPADGTENVPLSSTVSFTFSAPLDIDAHYGDLQLPASFFVTDPLDSLEFGEVSISADHQTISLEMTHTSNTDYVWIVIGAQSSTGDMLSQPYVLNYTTSIEHGAHSVSGTVSFSDGDPVNSIVSLLESSPFSDGKNLAVGGTVVTNSAGNYEMNYIRDGIYFPIAIKDIDKDGEFNPMENDALGVLDEDGNGQPDSILVSGSSITGIDLELKYLFEPALAGDYLDRAEEIADQLAPDQELREIGVHADPVGIDIDLDGKTFSWAYRFHSPLLSYPTIVIVNSLTSIVDSSLTGFPENELPLPENFIDSDAAMSIADANGGHDFEIQHNLIRRTLYGGNRAAIIFLDDTTKIVWVAEYESEEPEGSNEIYRVFVDMSSGEVITALDENDYTLPVEFSLSQNYPNPFNPSTKINYTIPLLGGDARGGLSAPTSRGDFAKVRLVIYDILGNEIRTLVNEHKSPGTYEVTLDASELPSGVYFYQLKAGAFTGTKKLVVLK